MLKRHAQLAKILRAAVILLFIPWHAAAAGMGVSATVDKTEVSMEDRILLSVVVSGERNAPQPVLPPLPDFRVQSSGSSSSLEIINGKMSSSMTFTYQLAPKRAGRFIIGPVHMDLGGATYKSEPITITVTSAPAAGADGKALAFAEADISNVKPYVNEQVVLTIRIYHRVHAQDIRYDLPYDDLRMEGLDKPKEYTQVINGINYDVHELAVALQSTRAGAVELASAKIDLVLLLPTQNRRSAHDPFSMLFNDPFFRRNAIPEPKTLLTKPFRLEVQPLPGQGKPAALQNLVGQFNITAELSKEALEIGDTATLTLTVSGTGNIQDAQMALPASLQDCCKIYPDQPALQKSVAGKLISGQKIFKYALVPLQARTVEIPPIPLSYFDPRARQYITRQTQPLFLKVTAADHPEKVTMAESKPQETAAVPGNVETLGSDILPIHGELSDFAEQGLPRSALPAYLAFLLAPAVFYVLAALAIEYRRRQTADPAGTRMRRAYKTARSRLEKLAGLMTSDQKTLARELSIVLREYIGDKLNFPGKALTAAELQDRLSGHKHFAEYARQVCALLAQYESLQYGMTAPQGQAATDLLKESMAIIDAMEKQG